MSLHVMLEASTRGKRSRRQVVPKHDWLPVLIENRPVAGLCHGLRVRLADHRDADLLLARFDECVASAGLTSSEAACWREDLPIASSHPAADRRRAVELSRSVSASGALRAVVLAFTDGVADLVLIASRRFIDGAALRSLAAALTDLRQPVFQVPLVRRYPAGGNIPGGSRATAVCEWGLGGQPGQPGRGTIDGGAWKTVVSPQRLISVTCIVLARFASQSHAAFGMIGEAGMTCAEDAPAARLIHADLENSSTFAALAATVERCISGEADEGALDGTVAVPVGVVWDAAHAGREASAEVRAYLALPFALTLEPRVEAGNVTGIVYGFDEACFALEMVRAFDRALAHVCAELERELTGGRDPVLASIGILDSAHALRVAALGAGCAVPAGFRPFRVEERIASLAASHPNAQALSYEDRSLSYRELDEFASRIAGVLTASGVREGDRVGVCLERSLELVPIMLAVFKAGAAYVPIDPAYPVERIAYTLDDARPSLVVAAGAVQAAPGTRTIELVALLEQAAFFDGVLTPPARSASAAAYVIYTSGSTGRPKGVVVPHSNVASLVAATADDFALSSEDTWTMFHSSAFDFSVWEIWGCLTTGGHLVVVPYWISRSPDEFAELLARERVTILNQTPSAFAQLIAAESRLGKRLVVRMVVFGGESLDTRTLLRWFDRYPETVCRLVNMFGITETTVHVTAETLTRVHAIASSRAVGRALPGWRLYVMDTYQNLLPPGVPGEIYVGGAGVADQYLNRPDLNAQRFLSDPFADGRMYRSGDRGRLLSDGRLEHLGRLDSQVKIRGFRIELDEIRVVLLEYPPVSAATVVVNYASAGDTASARLDAYIVLDSGTVADVRRHAAGQLPEHMVPSTVTVLESLPLTANGKLDAAKLPMPKFGAGPEAALVPSAQAVELVPERVGGTQLEALRAIWSDVLGVPVGDDDNFFELGGNSLFAVRVATAMRDGGLPALPLRELYLRQTLRGVVDYLAAPCSLASAPQAGSDLPEDFGEALPQLVAQTLGLPDAARGASFAGLGGSSLAAARLARRIETEWQRSCSVRAILAATSIAALAETLRHAPPPQVPFARGTAVNERLASPQQRSLYVEQIKNPASTAYNLPFVIEFDEAPDLSRLRASLAQLIARHPMLAASFDVADSVVMLRIRRNLPVNIPVIRDSASGLAKLVRPFELGNAPLWRAALIGGEAHQLFFDIHHVLCDGHALRVLFEEWDSIYRGAALEPTRMSYADYADWQRCALSDAQKACHRAFWLDTLQPLPPAVVLPTDRSRTETRSDRGGHVLFEIDTAQTAMLRELARRLDATLFQVLIAAYVIWLARVTSSRDMVVGVPFLGRHAPGSDRVFGICVNTVCLRFRLDVTNTFEQVVRLAARQTLAAEEHQDYAFDELVRELVSSPDYRRHPIFDTMFAFHDTGLTGMSALGGTVRWVPSATQAALFDLNLQIEPRPRGLCATWGYAEDVFDRATVEAFAAEFIEVLDTMISIPDETIAHCLEDRGTQARLPEIAFLF